MITNPESRDILALVERACEDDPALPALIFEDGLVVNRGRLWADVQSFAGYLEPRVTPGDRVGIMLSNRAEFMVAWLSVVACRAILVSMNPSAMAHDAGHILKDAGIQIVITDEEHAESLRSLRSECPALEEIIIVADDEPMGLRRYAGDWSGTRPPEAVGDMTNVYYTSGTTGPPKGCMVDHEYWLRFADLVLDTYGVTQSDRFLCCLQFFYNDPPWQLLVSLKAGTALVVMRRFSVSRYWNVVRANAVTILFGIASTASLLLKAPDDGLDRAHNVRLAIQIGIPAGLHRDLVDRWGIPWVEGYGLTETGLVVAMPPSLADEMVGSGSIGRPCDGVELQVVDAEGAVVPPGEPGEMVLRAPGLMRGYLNRPEATDELFAGGWLHTGDLGTCDSEGFLYFRGRIKDIIRRSGENIAAAEVENVIRSHPSVLEVAAVPASDDLRGEEVKVHVLLSPGESSESVTPADIVAFCTERLARYKVPRFIEYRSVDFERTPSMRVRKQDLDRTAGDPERVWDREKELGW